MSVWHRLFFLIYAVVDHGVNVDLFVVILNFYCYYRRIFVN